MNGDEDVLLICFLLILQFIIFISLINFVSIDVNWNESNKKMKWYSLSHNATSQSSSSFHPHPQHNSSIQWMPIVFIIKHPIGNSINEIHLTFSHIIFEPFMFHIYLMFCVTEQRCLNCKDESLMGMMLTITTSSDCEIKMKNRYDGFTVCIHITPIHCSNEFCFVFANIIRILMWKQNEDIFHSTSTSDTEMLFTMNNSRSIPAGSDGEWNVQTGAGCCRKLFNMKMLYPWLLVLPPPVLANTIF